MSHQFLEFMQNHWLLWAVFAALLVMVIINEFFTQTDKTRISPQDAVNLINQEDAQVYDLRDVKAFQEGHIIGAKSQSQTDLEQLFSSLKKYQDKPILLYCTNGQQSSLICQKLKKRGFSQICALAGGVQGWCAANLPLTNK